NCALSPQAGRLGDDPAISQEVAAICRLELQDLGTTPKKVGPDFLWKTKIEIRQNPAISSVSMVVRSSFHGRSSWGNESQTTQCESIGPQLFRQPPDTSFNGEFDSGSERTLAAWIRHASRTG